MWSRLFTVSLVWFLAAGVVQPAAARLPAPIEQAIQHVTAAELRAHIAVLASDRFAGRGLGHSGNREAEHYIAGALRDASVTAASGWRQTARRRDSRLNDMNHG